MNKVKLKDIVDIFNGSTPSTTQFDNFDGDIPWITPKDISIQRKKYIIKGERNITQKGLKTIGSRLLPKGTILFSSRAPIGLMSISFNEISTNQGFKNMVCKPGKVFSEYLYYLLKTKTSQIQELGTGTTFKEVSKATLENFDIYINENISVQRKIASVLSALDDKIEMNNKINTELEAMAKTLYDYWFVQFDFPNAEGKPYKSSGGEMFFDEVLKREIPKEWEVKNLDEIANIIAGGDKPIEMAKEKSARFKVPIYSNGIQNAGLYGFTEVPKVSKQSITISARGTIGFCFLRNKPFVPIIRLISVTPYVESTGVYYFYTIKNLVFENSGSVQQQLTVPQVSSLKIIEPSNFILEDFEKTVSPLNEKSENIKEQNQELASLRDWLLPMLMNGQVKVVEAYQEVEGELGMVAEECVEYKLRK